MNGAYISAIAALAGSSIGAFATFATTWLNQSYQNRIQRQADERSRRERLFGEFIDEAARAYSDALINDLEDPSHLVSIYSVRSRIALFSSDDVLIEADKIIQAITEKYFVQKMSYSELNEKTAMQFNLLKDFTRSCRMEMTRY